MVDTAERVRGVLAAHVQEHPCILGMNPPIRDEGFMVYAQRTGRGFYVACSCGDITDPGPRPNQDPGVTTDGSRLRAQVLGRQHLAAEITRALAGA